MPTPQPEGMKSGNGAIVTVGLEVCGEPCAIVLPLGTDDTTVDPNDTCRVAVNAVNDEVVPLIQACIAEDAYITYINGEGMTNGKVPYRRPAAYHTLPGTLGADALPSINAMILCFYQDADDLVEGARIPCGRNFIPGIASEHVSNNIADTALQTALEALATKLQEGFVDSASPSIHWYRVVSRADNRDDDDVDLQRVLVHLARVYICRQKRRLFPRVNG